MSQFNCKNCKIAGLNPGFCPQADQMLPVNANEWCNEWQPLPELDPQEQYILSEEWARVERSREIRPI